MHTTIYLVRHAESPYIAGQELTRGLSPAGWLAAQKVADMLQAADIHVIVSSPYARAKQTVQVLAERKGLPILEFEALRERLIIGQDYNAEWNEVVRAIEKSFTDLDYSLEAGESTGRAQERSLPVIRQLLADYPGKNIVIGTHGNIMTCILNFFLIPAMDMNFGAALRCRIFTV